MFDFDNAEPTARALAIEEMEMRDLDIDSDEWVDSIMRDLSPADLG